MNTVNRVMKARVIFQMPNVFKAASREVVQDKNFVAALQIRVGKVRANKAGASSDQNWSASRAESSQNTMFRLNKLTDYAVVLMTHIAITPEPSLHTARELAEGTQLPLATVGKVLR